MNDLLMTPDNDINNESSFLENYKSSQKLFSPESSAKYYLKIFIGNDSTIVTKN